MGIQPTDTIEEEAAHWLIDQKEPGFHTRGSQADGRMARRGPENRRVCEEILAAVNRYTFVGKRIRERGLEYAKKLYPLKWTIYDHPKAHPDHWGVQMSCGPWFDPHVHLFVELEDARAHAITQGAQFMEAAPSAPGHPEFWTQRAKLIGDIPWAPGRAPLRRSTWPSCTPPGHWRRW